MNNDEIDTIIDNEYLFSIRQDLALRKEELSADVHLKQLENKIAEEEKKNRRRKTKKQKMVK